MGFGTGMCQHFQRLALKMKQSKNHIFCFASRDQGRMPCVTHNNGAHNWNRTSDLFLTKEVLYHLSYMSLKFSQLYCQTGAGGGNRTRFISLEG